MTTNIKSKDTTLNSNLSNQPLSGTCGEHVESSSGEHVESMTLESLIQYACVMPDESGSIAITQMLMAQYMMQGLLNPELSQQILGIAARRQQLKREEEWKRLHPQGILHTDQLPPTLRTPDAIRIWQALYAESLVDEDCQTLRSRTESGIMAAAIAKRLGIRNVWVTFEEFWGIRNLKSAKDKAYDYQNGWNFEKRLNEIIPS